MQMLGTLDLAGGRVQNAGDPQSPQDAVTKTAHDAILAALVEALAALIALQTAAVKPLLN